MKTILTVPNLDLHSNLVHGFTTREIGDDYGKIAVELNPRIVTAPERIVRLNQIHSGTVVVVDKNADLKALPEGDALVTDRPGIVIGVKTADCLPILVYERKARVVAAIHAGWRGLAACIVQHTLEEMLRRFGCRIEFMEFAFGPCISEVHYEVGEEVIEKFREVFGVRFSYKQKPGAKPHLDLVGTARMNCEDVGFYHRNLAEVGLCTFERADLFHSHRRKAGEGRQFNFIGMV
jgi:YfiH family protein